ncbi:MAG: hypothetical protein HC802_12080, partial [Caldilineaceae bacterium]|nr:hypothetical protein [Caldilineaceae bacterium]
LPAEYEAAYREAAAFEQIAAVATEAGSLGELPLVVLTADDWTTGEQTPMKRDFVALHRELAALSSRGSHQIVDGSTHISLPILRADAVAAAVATALASERVS